MESLAFGFVPGGLMSKIPITDITMAWNTILSMCHSSLLYISCTIDNFSGSSSSSLSKMLLVTGSYFQKTFPTWSIMNTRKKQSAAYISLQPLLTPTPVNVPSKPLTLDLMKTLHLCLEGLAIVGTRPTQKSKEYV
jgi:hypothetical protein